MTVKIASVTFDCADALTVGRFWPAAAGRPLDPKVKGCLESLRRSLLARLSGRLFCR